MAVHKVSFLPQTVASSIATDVTKEVSFDNGTTFRKLTSQEETQGFSVKESQRFVARLSKPRHHTVQQGLIVKPGTDPILDFDGGRDFGSESLSSVASNAGLDRFHAHTYSAWVTLFRNATAERARRNVTDPPAFPHTILSFNGTEVLSDGGTAFGRFAATLSRTRSHEPSVGRLVFLLTADDSLPQVLAAFVPNSVNLNAAVPVHIFFIPSTGRKVGDYPFSTGPNSFSAVFDNFLSGGGKRMINQHVAANKQCVFLVPLAPPQSYFRSIQSADKLRRYCLEAVYFLQRTVGRLRMPIPRLGRCALSGFSEAGQPLNSVIASSPNGSAFPELAELYLLDVVSPAGSTTDTASYQGLLNRLAVWKAAGSDRRVRIYTQSPQFRAATQPAIKGPVAVSNAGAQDHRAANATFAFLPIDFWRQLASEQVGTTPSPGYERLNPASLVDGGDAFSAIHQLIPCVFMQHALVNSGFA